MSNHLKVLFITQPLLNSGLVWSYRAIYNGKKPQDFRNKEKSKEVPPQLKSGESKRRKRV